MAEMWHYTSEGKQMEPVTWTELKQLAASGFLRLSDMVWKEGMENWVRATTIESLFSEATMAGASSGGPIVKKRRQDADEDERPSRKRNRDEEDDDDRPRRKKSRDEEEDDDDRPRRKKSSEDDEDDDERPRKRRKSKYADEDDDDDIDIRKRRRRRDPASSGLKIGLIAGGAVLVIGLVVTLVVVLATSKSAAVRDLESRLPANAKIITSFTVSVRGGAFDDRTVQFTQGKMYRILAKSDTNSDVDVWIMGALPRPIAGDGSVGPDSMFNFMPPPGGPYRVRVHNVDMIDNRTHVVIAELP